MSALGRSTGLSHPGRKRRRNEDAWVCHPPLFAVADGMRPYVVDRVTAPDGSTVVTTKPDPLGRAIQPLHAAQINQMMQAVVTGGTGTAAQISGVKVAGKTGTAETGENHVNTTWFIAFAPADNPRYAVAVVVERQHATGGEVAAPIAKQILEALLNK